MNVIKEAGVITGFFLKRSGIAMVSNRLAVRCKCGGVLRLASLSAHPATAFRYHQGYSSSSDSFCLRQIFFLA